jgi:hypothetical protein
MKDSDQVAVPTGPQVQRREKWVPLPDEYEGFEFRMWVNAPNHLFVSVLTRGDSEALQKIVLEHNGWRDFDGQPYPPATELAFWEQIPNELAACVIAQVQVEMGKLAASQRQTKRR